MEISMKSRVEKAIENHCKGYNCSQAVVCAYHELLGMDEQQVFKLAEGFGSGMGGLRETCGAVTGMFMVASYLESDGNREQNDSRQSCYALVHELAERFESKNGSLICHKLLECQQHQRHEKLCTSYVEDAANLLDELIIKKDI